MRRPPIWGHGTWSGWGPPPGFRGAARGGVAPPRGFRVVVKGVLRAGDARRCLNAGAAAVWVSNHGGRQLDYSAATADCLAEVAAEVGGAAEVYVDGGVREARHVLAGLALGARAAFLGRLPLYALAVEGAAGVHRLLADLEVDLVDTLLLAGCPSVSDVPRDLVGGSGGRFMGG